MSESKNKIDFFIEESGEKVEFYVIEQVTINNATYLLVSENDDQDDSIIDDGLEVYVLKQKQIEGEDIVYEMVESDEELTFVYKIFAEKLDEYELD